jgi:hypothetical protein
LKITGMDAMKAQGIDSSVTGMVGDAIGHLCASTLDVLRAIGVPARTVMNLRRALPAEAVSDSGRVPVGRVSACPCCGHVMHCVISGI